MAMVSRRRKRRRYAAPIGGAFMLLALIGVVTVVVGAIGLTDRILDNQSDKRQLEDIIRPVLMWDPPPFENPEDVSPTLMLHFSMWATLMDENANYTLNENMEMMIPASDLDVAAHRLFGPGVTLQHRSFGDYEQSYYFDSVRRVYLVSATAQLFLYSPRVIYIEREGDLYHVRVGYVPPEGFTADIRGARGEPEPEKYMIYVMRRAGDTFQIAALRDDPNLVVEIYTPE